jgi:hypothetical protein
MSRIPHAALALFLSVPIFSSPPPPRVPIVVELFTSEGCSSCPPADAFLAELGRTQPVSGAEIIPLEEHVDYWNSLGWRDPFSSAAITERQEDYARRFRLSGPYTPQMVIAGRTQFSGNAGSQVRAAIVAAAQVPSFEVSLAVASEASDSKARASIRVNELPANSPEPAEVFLAITEDALASHVSAGENSGRRLVHSAVLRRLSSVGRIKPGQPLSAEERIAFDRDWKHENLRIVAFLAGAKTGHILGAAAVRVAP